MYMYCVVARCQVPAPQQSGGMSCMRQGGLYAGAVSTSAIDHERPLPQQIDATVHRWCKGLIRHNEAAYSGSMQAQDVVGDPPSLPPLADDRLDKQACQAISLCRCAQQDRLPSLAALCPWDQPLSDYQAHDMRGQVFNSLIRNPLRASALLSRSVLILRGQPCTILANALTTH